MAHRRQWVSPHDPVALTRQCELAGVACPTVYAPYSVAEPDERALALLAAIDAEYSRHPFYGSHKREPYLRGVWHRSIASGDSD